MFTLKTLAAASVLFHFSAPALAFSYNDYDVLYSRDADILEHLYTRDIDDFEHPLLRRIFTKASFKTGDLSPERQAQHAASLQTLMNEDFQRTREDKLNGPGRVSGDARRHWKDAVPPMLDTIHKPGTDGKLHYGTSAGNRVSPPQHEPATNKMMDACGGPGNHNSRGRCAEHAAIDSYHHNNPLGSIKGANSLSVGERASDRKSGNPGARQQEACRGANGKAGCEDHLRAAGINDLVHSSGTRPGDDAKKNKNKPGGLNRKEPYMRTGSSIDGRKKIRSLSDVTEGLFETLMRRELQRREIAGLE